jgi:hypothetical protein
MRQNYSADTPASARFEVESSHSWGSPNSRKVRLPWFLVIYLGAITIIGKGPTYLGFPPLYWGEFVMALSLIKIAPWAWRRGYLGRTPYLTALILAYMTLGAVLTALSFNRWRLDALRDAAIWYYGLFFFIGLGLASRLAIADRFWRVIRIIWIAALIWNTLDILSRHALSHFGPVIPWRGVPLFFNSIHEGGQNLALGALIVLCTTTLHNRPILRPILVLVAALGLGVFAASDGRGMRVGFASALLVLLLLSFSPRRRPHFDQRLLQFLIPAIPVVTLLALLFSGEVLKLSNLDRFKGVDPLDPDGTVNWRLIWWQRLYDHVIETNPIVGMGFGESLHYYNPLLESDEEEFVVRSPHNFNVTVFSRMGFLGFFLWIGILIAGIGRLWLCAFRGMARGQPYADERRDELAFWVAMLVCTVVNSSFGVLMEGPVLGIWFWFALGFANGRSFTTGRPNEILRRKLGLLILRGRLAERLAAAN